MTYTQAAVERAMKVYEVLVQALKERQPWIHVAEVLGVSARTVRRLRWRYEHDGFEGLFDHRRRTPSPRCAPVAEVQRVVRLYAERYHGFNVRHPIASTLDVGPHRIDACGRARGTSG